MNRGPFIVGIGGTVRARSAPERALEIALSVAERCGARTRLFGGPALTQLPHYGVSSASEGTAVDLIAAIREADGLIIASPGYHGTISGLVKNAIDYLEDTTADARKYLDGLPVGLIVTAYGWQATGTTLGTLRSMVHALRGWPTPLGVGINCGAGAFAADSDTDPQILQQLEVLGRQVVGFASRLQGRAAASRPPTGGEETLGGPAFP